MQKKISSYISTDLQKKAQLLHRLTWVAGIDNRTLTIVTDDPSRASIIRYQQRELLKQLNQELSLTVKEYLNQIKVKICNVINGVNHPTKVSNLSPTSANHIEKCAKDIKDLDLQNAMKRLAKRGMEEPK